MKEELILEIVFTVLLAAASVFLLPWLKERLGAEKLKSLWTWVCVAVQAAEQIFGAKTGAQKKEYVRSWLKDKGVYGQEETMDALIEAAVHELTE